MAGSPPTGLRGSAATRLKLREAAWAVFQQHGLAGTTVRAIATSAGRAVGSLYTYYPDKEALLDDLTLAALAELGREVAARADEPPVVAVTAAMRAVFGAERPAAALLGVLLRPGQAASPEFGRRVVGRLLTALAPLVAERADLAPRAAEAHALAAAAFAFGLTLFESSGLLERLGGDAGAVVAAYRG